MDFMVSPGWETVINWWPRSYSADHKDLTDKISGIFKLLFLLTKQCFRCFKKLTQSTI